MVRKPVPRFLQHLRLAPSFYLRCELLEPFLVGARCNGRKPEIIEQPFLERLITQRGPYVEHFDDYPAYFERTGC